MGKEDTCYIFDGTALFLGEFALALFDEVSPAGLITAGYGSMVKRFVIATVFPLRG